MTSTLTQIIFDSKLASSRVRVLSKTEKELAVDGKRDERLVKGQKFQPEDIEYYI
jgi:hypothetical protein